MLSCSAVRTWSGPIVHRHSDVRRELAPHPDAPACPGLPGRESFVKRIETIHCPPERQSAVLVIELDRFRGLEDGLGLIRGDGLLEEVTARLLAARPTGSFVARLSRATFAMVCPNLPLPSGAAELAARVLAKLDEPYEVGDEELCLRARAGVAVRDGRDDEPLRLLRNAETALFAARRTGERVVFFEPRFAREAVARFELENDLRRSLARGELALVYQPLVDLEDGHVTGFEALVRWHHGRRGVLTPDQFLPLAHEIDLLVEIDKFSLGEAARQLASWRLSYPDLPRFPVAVNLSARLFASPELPLLLHRLLATWCLEPGDLRLELTEAAELALDDTLIASLAELGKQGFALVLDDFGMGFSSLAYLQRVPARALKIDRSFIGGMLDHAAQARIVGSVLELGRRLGITVVAEGVETRRQAELLVELGCREAQGYLFDEPLAAAEVPVSLGRRSW